MREWRGIPSERESDESFSVQDSIPRYTSAKYLARISLQSPPELAVQVVETVLAEFETALLDDAQEQGEGRVQGACLALGEMARCGVLARLPAAEKDDVVKRVLSSTLQVSQSPLCGYPQR